MADIKRNGYAITDLEIESMGNSEYAHASCAIRLNGDDDYQYGYVYDLCIDEDRKPYLSDLYTLRYPEDGGDSEELTREMVGAHKFDRIITALDAAERLLKKEILKPEYADVLAELEPCY